MLQNLIDQILAFFGTIGYWDIFVLMTIESSIIPFPSEVIMIPAGISAASGNIDAFMAAIVGGLGSLFWAFINYYIVWKYLGKPFLLKYGKYFFIKHKDYERAEKLFLENANLYTFIGRLTPVIRQLISVPAGIFGMKILPFTVLTFLGATIWSAVLVALGYYFGEWVISVVKEYSHEATIVLIPLLTLYIFWKILAKK
jgi:membrane protein DedA with SNARE-associated domain